MNTRILLTISMLIVSVWTTHAQSFETATEAVKNMGVGWNLGNTLDANNNNGGRQDLSSETCWGQPYTKPELMKMMKEAGFGAIRIPVTWFPHMDSSNKVDAAWMKRVHEVVDYVIDNGMYCLLNVHHDTGDGSFHWLHASMNTYNNVKAKYESLWTQIAEEFKDYGDKLLFESYNEMLDEYNSWCFATFARSGGYHATDAADAYQAINSFAQSFVNAVRATGGNNAKRNLVVNTYGACNGAGNWNSHLKDPLKEMIIPSDAIAGAGHIAVQVHAYPNVKNISSMKTEVNDMFNALNTYFISKGTPVIIGEWGTANDGEVDYDVRHENVMQFVDFFVKAAKAKNCGTFLWMGLSDGTNRSVPVFNQADLAEAIMKAYYGSSDGYKFPTREDLGTTVYDVSYTNQWSELNLYSNSLSTSSNQGVELELAEAPTSGTLQFKVYKNDNTDMVQGITTANSTLKFTSNMGTTLKRITLQCCIPNLQITVKNVYLIKSDGTKLKKEVTPFWGCTVDEKIITGIQPAKANRPTDKRFYNLKGQQIVQPKHGIYIQNGKKYIK
ncbi:MAG: glycoside hydrolase family 5 protein [Prevotella sp.]|nr:glycoside hydrolase family 5 protein [Prevotella sp.]